MDNPKVLVLVGLLVAALFVFALVWGGTQPAQFAVPDPDDPGAMGALEGLLHGLPGLGPGRNLEPRDLAGTACGNGRNLRWSGLCTIDLPEDVGVATFQHQGHVVRIELDQDGAVDDRVVLPRDLRRGQVTRTLRVFGDGGRLRLRCIMPVQNCQLGLVDS